MSRRSLTSLLPRRLRGRRRGLGRVLLASAGAAASPAVDGHDHDRDGEKEK